MVYLHVSLFFLDDLKDLSRRVSEANTAKCEALAKVDEIHSNEVNKEVKHYHYILISNTKIYFSCQTEFSVYSSRWQ